MGVRGKGTAFESPCPAQQCRNPRYPASRANAPPFRDLRSKGGVVAADERQLKLQASRCYEFHGPTLDVF
jgi:hypothetical protein